MSDVNTFVANIEKVRNNPNAIIRLVLDQLEEATNGVRVIPDPTNPFVFSLETGITLASIGMQQADSLMRKQYPSLAQTEDDLYRHMSSVDYLNRFSTPSRTSFRILIGLEELRQKAVPVPNSRISKIVIPRNTEFSISDYKFTMQYPIEIRIMGHGGLQIVYDVTKPSPLQVLETNVVQWDVINLGGVDYIRLDIPTQQVQITTQYTKINNTSGFTQSYDFADQYYYCRAYMTNDSGNWVEIKTTHTDQVFDINVPTVVLKVKENVLDITIPPIYFATNLIDREIRFDIYTTKGPLEMSLDTYDINSFFAVWRDIAPEDGGIYTAPLSTFAFITVYSTSLVTGGSNGLTFEQLRSRVINGTLNTVDNPVTNIQLSVRLEDLGYQLVKEVDNTTNRIYQATRALPQPGDLSTITGIGGRLGKFISSMDKLLLLDTVMNNNNRITLLPKTLYSEIAGIINPVGDGVIEYLLSLPNDSLVANINTTNYLYTPFHYVLDINDSVFDVRPYYLDKPVIESKVFVAENDTTLLGISTQSLSIERIEHGYRIIALTLSGDTYKALDNSLLHAQLSYTPVGENSRAYLNGTLVGTDPDTGERVFQFDLLTNYDLNKNDQLILTSFKIIDAETDRFFATQLTTTFDLVYAVADYSVPEMEVSGIDQYLAPYLMPDGTVNYVGLIQERITVELGSSLEGLWSKSRSIVSGNDYETYEADVPYTYDTNVYEMDGNTNSIKIYNDNGVLRYNLLHAQGDPILDELNQPLIRHLKGTTKFNEEGNPVIKNPRAMAREIGLLMLDGKYYFATDENTVSYRDTVPSNIVTWLDEDIIPVSKKLHENTELYYYPQSTLGYINAVIDGGDVVYIPAEQTFRCRVFLTKQAYNNAELRKSITATITDTLATALKSNNVSMKDIIRTLTEKLGNDVVGLEIKGLGGDKEVNTMTIQDDSQRAVIRKYLAATSDGKLRVQDDIIVDYTVHNP